MSKLIREGRFGKPKTFKTGAVVGSYPKPLLHLGLDPEGIDVVPSEPTKDPKRLKMDVIVSDVQRVYLSTDEKGVFTPSQLEEFKSLSLKKREELSKVVSIDFTRLITAELDAKMQPYPESNTLVAMVDICNQLVQRSCPWKTVVLDSVTELNDSVLRHISRTNNTILADSRKWAGQAGAKIKQIIGYLRSLPNTHLVVIFHSTFRENEITNKVNELPMMHSNIRDVVGMLFSQWFYQQMVNGVPKVLTADKMFVEGIGTRWPELPGEVGPMFGDIYGKEKLE